MEKQISSFVELRKSVKRTEHECNNGKCYRNSAHGSKLDSAKLFRIFFETLENQKYCCNDSAKDIRKNSVKLEILQSRCLQSAFLRLTGDHENNAGYRKDDHYKIQYDFRFRMGVFIHLTTTLLMS